MPLGHGPDRAGCHRPNQHGRHQQADESEAGGRPPPVGRFERGDGQRHQHRHEAQGDDEIGHETDPPDGGSEAAVQPPPDGGLDQLVEAEHDRERRQQTLARTPDVTQGVDADGGHQSATGEVDEG
ncbi:MAG: hypothetical protein OEY41_01645 [Acidimicrobiia bacterium]|nr:hypothetical protein [Acidimicrobiia bacterium]MDH5288681.1 hypothetical protein [Acidimicrobiia bacterium]